MNFLVSLLLTLCLLVSQLSPFSVFFLKIRNELNAANNKPEEIVEEPVVVEAEPETEEVVYNVNLNNTLDLDGYCTIMIPSAYFKVVNDQTTFTKKVVKYTDNKTRLTMSYVINISDDADIPGYLVREAAGVDTVTNLKHEEEYKSGTWMVVPSESQVDGNNTTVYYIVSPDETTAFWLRADVYPDSDNEEFAAVLTAILDSYNMYFLGNTVFNTPSSGYYAENQVDGEGVIGDTTNYQANTTNHSVYQTNVGFIQNAGISNDWKDMEIIIDDTKIKLPCTMQDLYDAGFKINDRTIKSGDVNIHAGANTTVSIINSKGTVVNITILNESNTEQKAVDECNVVKLSIDTSKFLSLADMDKTVYHDTDEKATKDEQSTEENSEEGSEEDDESEQLNGSSWSNSIDSYKDKDPEAEENRLDDSHKVIIAGGITLNIYTEDLINYFGSNATTTSYGNEMKYTWTSDTLSMSIRIGIVQNIKSIELSTVQDLQ